MPVPAVNTVHPNEARIRELRARIDEEARKLALEQKRFTQTAQSAAGPGVPVSPGVTPAFGAAPQATIPYLPRDVPAPREKNWIAADQEKREYESRYASNIALSRRNAEPNSVSKKVPPEAGTNAVRESSTTGGPTASSDGNPVEVAKTYRVFEGTVIETVLTNRLDGSFSGPINCLVTTNVYSPDRIKLLIPQGSRVLGNVQKVETFGQQRLAVTFHRLILPNGFSVKLEQPPGLSAAGETGLVDKINRHYLQTFGVSLAIGAIAGLSQANTRYGGYGAPASADDAYRQGVASSLSQSSLEILNRYLNVLPTFTIREGHRIKVYLTADLLLPAYQAHQPVPEFWEAQP